MPEVLDPIAKITRDMWGAIPVVRKRETGARGGIYLRSAKIAVYGASDVFLNQDHIRAHGRDERIGGREFYEGVEASYQLVNVGGGR